MNQLDRNRLIMVFVLERDRGGDFLSDLCSLKNLYIADVTHSAVLVQLYGERFWQTRLYPRSGNWGMEKTLARAKKSLMEESDGTGR